MHTCYTVGGAGYSGTLVKHLQASCEKRHHVSIAKNEIFPQKIFRYISHSVNKTFYSEREKPPFLLQAREVF